MINLFEFFVKIYYFMRQYGINYYSNSGLHFNRFRAIQLHKFRYLVGRRGDAFSFLLIPNLYSSFLFIAVYLNCFCYISRLYMCLRILYHVASIRSIKIKFQKIRSITLF